MFCYNCGTRLEENEKFCYRCGAKVRDRSGRTPVMMTPEPETEWEEIPAPTDNQVKPETPGWGTPEALEAATMGSVGTDMPAEENQRNSGLPVQKYFEKVLSEVFPDAYVEVQDVSYPGPARWVKSGLLGKYHSEPGEKKPAWLFLVRKDRLPILAVEVMAIYNKSRTKLRTSYTKNGVPYIRFYHDVDVWWNTKSYIRERALQAVK